MAQGSQRYFDQVGAHHLIESPFVGSLRRKKLTDPFLFILRSFADTHHATLPESTPDDITHVAGVPRHFGVGSFSRDTHMTSFRASTVRVVALHSGVGFKTEVDDELLVYRDRLVLGEVAGYRGGGLTGVQILVQNAEQLPQYGQGEFRLAAQLAVGKGKTQGGTVLRYDARAAPSRTHALIHLEVDTHGQMDIVIGVPSECVLERYESAHWRGNPGGLHLLLLVPFGSRISVEGTARPHSALRDFEDDDPDRELLQANLSGRGIKLPQQGQQQTAYIAVRKNGTIVAGGDEVALLDDHDGEDEVNWM